MGLLGDFADFGKEVIGNEVERAGWAERAVKAAATSVDAPIGRLLARAAQSPIMAAGQQTIESMKQGTGVGDPEDGQRFSAGADNVGTAGQVLVSAFPDDSWDSGGASAYAGRNTEQVGRVQTMLGLDTLVAGVLSTEAGQISAARTSLDGHADWLGAMSLLSAGAGVIPGVGQAGRMTAEIAMVAKAVGEATDDLETLRGQVDENAARLHSAAAQYEALAGDVTPNEAEFARPTLDPEAQPPAEDPEAGSPGGTTGGAPAGGSGGGVPTAAPGLPTPSSLPGAASPSTDVVGAAAGALGGLLGSLLSPLSAILGGVMQAFGQAAQAATQAGTQAAEMVTGKAGSTGAALDEESGNPGGDLEPDDRAGEEARGKDAEDDRDDEKRGHEKDRDTESDGDSEAQRATDPLDAQADDGPAKTLPPNLEAAALDVGGAGTAPVHVGADFEQGQLHVRGAATLDRGVPGSAAVIDR